MEITKEYNIELIEWEIRESQDFIGRNQLAGNYAISLTPPYNEDPAYCFFTVRPKFFIENEHNGVVVTCSTKSCFLLKNEGCAPPRELLYSLIVIARNSLNEIYLFKNADTVQRNHHVPTVVFDEVILIIEESIRLAYPK